MRAETYIFLHLHYFVSPDLCCNQRADSYKNFDWCFFSLFIGLQKFAALHQALNNNNYEGRAIEGASSRSHKRDRIITTLWPTSWLVAEDDWPKSSKFSDILNNSRVIVQDYHYDPILFYELYASLHYFVVPCPLPRSKATNCQPSQHVSQLLNRLNHTDSIDAQHVIRLWF